MSDTQKKPGNLTKKTKESKADAPQKPVQKKTAVKKNEKSSKPKTAGKKTVEKSSTSKKSMSIETETDKTQAQLMQEGDIVFIGGYIKKSTKSRFSRYAKSRYRTMSQELNKAIDTYLDMAEKGELSDN